MFGKGVGLAALAAVMMVSGPAFAQDQEFSGGHDEFMATCAVCHGTDAKGHGEFASVLRIPPADLTVLAKNNNGEFPFLDVFHTIDGRTQIASHGTSQMPIWGRRYKEEAGDTFGPYGGEEAVRARVLELVYYIQSIQQK